VVVAIGISLKLLLNDYNKAAPNANPKASRRYLICTQLDVGKIRFGARQNKTSRQCNLWGYNLLLRADPVSVVAQTNIGEASG